MAVAHSVERAPEAPNAAVIVTAVSGFSGKQHKMVFGISLDRFMECRHRWYYGATVQAAFPMLNASEREFLITGITPAEWDAMFADE